MCTLADGRQPYQHYNLEHEGDALSRKVDVHSYQTTRRHTLNDHITCGFHIARVTVLYWTHP